MSYSPNRLITSPVPQFSNQPYLNYQNTQPQGYAQQEDREEQYNYQIQKMSDHINELDHENKVLRNQNDTLNQDLYQLNIDLANYKETLKKFYVHYCEQMKQKVNLQQATYNQNQEMNNLGEHQITQSNDMQNLVLDRDLLLNKLEIGDKQYKFDVSSLTAQLNDKNAELGEARRRINELLEIKRKSEEEISSLRFTLEHQNQKLETDLREKALKLEQIDRQYADALYLKDREIADSLEKIKNQEHEIRRLLDLNRNYAQELSMLARDNRFKNQGLAQKDDRPAQQNKITVEASNMDPRIPPQFQQKMNDKINAMLDMYANSHKRELKELAMNLWKCKTELQNKNKQNKSLLMNDQKGSTSNALGGKLTDIKQTQSSSQMIIDGQISVIQFIRDELGQVIFELFVRSINTANSKKTNSLIIFILNLKELRDRFRQGLWISLETYAKLRKLLRNVLSVTVGNTKQKIEMAIGKLLKDDMDFRDNVNKWLQGTIAYTIQKKTQEKWEKNQDFLFLFRLLTIKYRIRYPLHGKTFPVDPNIDAFLDHKICYALRKVLNQDEE